MSHEKVSIIVPVYKVEKYLSRCVDSLLKQTYRNIEIILVDDGSPDRSPALCDEYARRDGRVKVIHQKNQGVSAARNAGIRAAIGAWIQFVDSDDWLEPDYTEKLYEGTAEHEVDLVIAGMKGVNEKGETGRRVPERTEVIDCKTFVERFWMFLEGGLLSSPCDKLFRRERMIHLFDPEMSCGEDLHFNMNFMQNARKISFVQSDGYCYWMPQSGARVHPKRDVQSCIVFSESVRTFLSEYLQEREYISKWEKFFFVNVCGDVKTIAVRRKSREAYKLVGEYAANEKVRNVLRREIWKSFPVKYKLTGQLISHNMVGTFIVCARILG